MIVKTSDGDEFTGTAVEIVRQMKNTEWNAPRRKRHYMLEVVERVEDMTGVFVNQDEIPTFTGDDEAIDPMNFLRYLEQAGIVKIEE